MNANVSELPYEIRKRNFRNVQIDAIGVALSTAAAPFLPVFLTRMGASNLQVGLLTAMPGVTGLVLALVIGRFLQTRRNIVPWFSGYPLAGAFQLRAHRPGFALAAA